MSREQQGKRPYGVREWSLVDVLRIAPSLRPRCWGCSADRSGGCSSRQRPTVDHIRSGSARGVEVALDRETNAAPHHTIAVTSAQRCRHPTYAFVLRTHKKSRSEYLRMGQSGSRIPLF